ncbi:Ser/Thr phosphatase family superfamily protein [Balamuthia mandrillaris]
MTLQVRSFEVGVLHLHPSLHGLKIAQLTDIHFNDQRLFVKGASDAVLQAAVEAVEREAVDLVVLTGDYVDLWPEAVTVLADRWLSKLTSKYGTVAILGNHDYQRAHSQRLVLEAFQSVGIHTLVNQRAEPINEWLEVMGVGDFWKDYHPDAIMCPLSGPSTTGKKDDTQDDDAELGSAEEERGVYRKTRLVLTHNPDSSLHLNQWGADLMLAGHTHGGHLRRAWNCIMPRRKNNPDVVPKCQLGYDWVHVPRVGEVADYERQAIPLYVCRGLDYVPLSPAEVAVFTLVPGEQGEQVVREVPPIKQESD